MVSWCLLSSVEPSRVERNRAEEVYKYTALARVMLLSKILLLPLRIT